MKKALKILSIVLILFLAISMVSAHYQSSWSRYFDEEETSYKKVKHYEYDTPWRHRDDYFLEEKKEYSKTISEHYDNYYKRDYDYYKPHRYNPSYKYYNKYYTRDRDYHPTRYTHSKYRNDPDHVRRMEDYHRYDRYRHHYYDWRDTSPYYYYRYYPSYGTTYRTRCHYNSPRWSLFYRRCP